MISRIRYEYFFDDGRIKRRMVLRPDHVEKWRFDLEQPNLVAVIEPRSGSFHIREGPAATPERIVDAVRDYEGVLVDATISDVGPLAPADLIRDVISHIETGIAAVLAQFPSYAEETDITGSLKGRIESPVFEREGWQARVRTWTYSRRPKERELGADVGLIVDLSDGERRVVKALWFQAKKSDGVPETAEQVEDLPRQIASMRKETPEAYTLIYTVDGVYAFEGDNFKSPLELASVVRDALFCKRGDRTPRVVALTADSRILLDVLVQKANKSA